MIGNVSKIGQYLREGGRTINNSGGQNSCTSLLTFASNKNCVKTDLKWKTMGRESIAITMQP